METHKEMNESSRKNYAKDIRELEQTISKTLFMLKFYFQLKYQPTAKTRL